MEQDNQNEVAWPPAPIVTMEGLRVAPERPYLTVAKSLDIVLGIIMGLTFQPLVTYAIGTGLYYLIIAWYHIPKPPSGILSMVVSPLCFLWCCSGAAFACSTKHLPTVCSGLA